MNKIHYCPISPIQRKFGLYITGAGRETTKPGEAYPHEYHSSDYYFTWQNGRTLPDWEYQLLYICDGRGVIQFKRGKSIHVGAGTIIILHPGEWHRYRPDPDTGWSEAYVGIGGEFLKDVAAAPFFTPSQTVLKTEPNGRFHHDLLELVEEIQADSVTHPYTLALKTMTLMMTLCENTSAQSANTSHNIAIRRANLHIAHHLGEVVDFQKLAKSLGMGYTIFRRRFQQYNGMAPLEYQIALRLRRAMHLLKSSDVPIAQIASDTGFRSAAYFSKFFHDHVGSSPIQFRLSNRPRPSRGS